MQIKRFEAKNMTEALRSIKKEFGPEAVILSARTLKKERGIFGHPKSTGVEVSAAIDTYYPDYKTNNSLKRYPNYPADQQNRNGHEGERNPLIEAFEKRITAAKHNTYPIIKRNDIPQTIQKLFEMHQQLLFQGVREDISLELIGRINSTAVSDEFFKNDAVKQCLAQILEEMGVKTERVKLRSGNQKIVAFIGPTGVGKTTTLAKLAAVAKTSRKKRRVALITLDNYRIAAVEQLKIYAKIFGIPIEAPTNNREFKKYFKKLTNSDLILIDTAGINPKNGDQIKELNRYFEKIPSAEIHLLLNATTKESTLDETLEKFQDIPISRLIFTKLDECTTYGTILNQLFRTKIPVSYFTNGQQIPDDLEVATTEKLVDLLLKQEQPKELWTGHPESLADSMTVFERMFNAVNTKVASGRLLKQSPTKKFRAISH